MRKRLRVTVSEADGGEGPLPRRILCEVVPAREIFPELEPADPVAGEAEATQAVADDVLPADARAARITTYALNAIVMIFAMPAGAALLVLNVLGGENLRATAHGLALTGAYAGIMSTPQGAAILGALL